VARPRSGTTVDDGHIAQARIGLHTSLGVVSGSYANVARAAFPGSGFDEHQSAIIGYEGETEHQSLMVEGGWYSVAQSRSAGKAGAAVDAQYRYTNGEATVLASWRKVPGMLRGAGGAHDEAMLSASLPLVGRLGVMGWAMESSMPILGDYTLDTRSASAGLRYSGDVLRGSVRAGVQHTGGFLGAAGNDQRSINATMSANLSNFAIVANTEAGVVETDTSSEPLANYSLGVQWRSGSQSVWLNGTHGKGLYGELPWHLDFGSELRIGRLEVQAGANTELTGRSIASSTAWWLSTTTRVVSGASLVLGTEYQPWRNGSPLRASAGVRMRVGVPVPTLPGSHMSGVVYDDANGNGVRDKGEAGVPGVVMRLGADNATTDENGRFSLPEGDRAAIILDVVTLPTGVIAPPLHMQPRGTMSVGVVRVARLVIQLRETAADTFAMKPAAGLTLTLADAGGRTRDAVSGDDGNVTFAALAPGVYTISVTPLNARGVALTPIVSNATVTAGVDQTVRVVVPSRTLEVHINNMNNNVPKANNNNRGKGSQ
jgi:hypothetical protein